MSKAPVLARRRSSRIAETAHPYGGKPELKKRGSTTADLRGALEGLSTEDLDVGKVVSAAGARAKFMAMSSDAAKPKLSDAEVRSKNKFDSKLAKFEGKASISSGSGAASARGVKGKLAAFEQKKDDELAALPSIKKTWKAGPGGQYRKTTQISGAPPGKKSLADLP